MSDQEPEAAGEAVLDRAVDAAVAEFGPGLSAAYALGSLAHGGFAPLVSDVDLLLVLDGVGPATAGRVAGVRDVVRRDLPGELAGRLSVFWSDRDGVRTGAGPHDRLPEVDRLDLLEAGRLLLGGECRAGASAPSLDTLVTQAAEFVLARFDDAYLAGLRDPATLVAGGPRPASKAVLFPVRFLYTLATGRVGHNDDAAAWYPTRHPHAELVAAATAWRTAGLRDPAAARELLARHLRPIHAIFAARYAEALHERGYTRLAGRTAHWGTLVG